MSPRAGGEAPERLEDTRLLSIAAGLGLVPLRKGETCVLARLANGQAFLVGRLRCHLLSRWTSGVAWFCFSAGQRVSRELEVSMWAVGLLPAAGNMLEAGISRC